MKSNMQPLKIHVIRVRVIIAQAVLRNILVRKDYIVL